MESSLIGIIIGTIITIFFVSISIPEFRKMRKNKEENKKKELENKSNSNFKKD